MKILLILAWAFCTGLIQAQSVISNGDFSNGLNGWTVVQPPGNTVLAGNLGQIQFAGEPNLSEAFAAQVGSESQQNLEQMISLTAGVQYNFLADAATTYPSFNFDGGTLSLSIGGNSVTSISFGAQNGGSAYGTLEGTYNPAQTGDELLVINFNRSYAASSESPTDYIGNISLSTVPEPSALSFMGIGTILIFLHTAFSRNCREICQ